jgi:hypothetical protein
MIARTNLRLPSGEVVDVRVVVNDNGTVRLEAIPGDRLSAAVAAGSTNTTLKNGVEHHYPALNVGIEGQEYR